MWLSSEVVWRSLSDLEYLDKRSNETLDAAEMVYPRVCWGPPVHGIVPRPRPKVGFLRKFCFFKAQGKLTMTHVPPECCSRGENRRTAREIVRWKFAHHFANTFNSGLGMRQNGGRTTVKCAAAKKNVAAWVLRHFYTPLPKPFRPHHKVKWKLA